MYTSTCGSHRGTYLAHHGIKFPPWAFCPNETSSWHHDRKGFFFYYITFAEFIIRFRARYLIKLVSPKVVGVMPQVTTTANCFLVHVVHACNYYDVIFLSHFVTYSIWLDNLYTIKNTSDVMLIRATNCGQMISTGNF